MRHVLLIAMLVVACKGKGKDGAGSGSAGFVHPEIADAAVAPPVDWKKCDAALRKAATAPLDARPLIIIDGCKVCGDWKPLLEWAKPQAEKGPSRAEIETAMNVCGYCNANAKQRFLGTLDNARGTNARTPWRFLGEQCKAEVSAVPDNRFTDAPFYALDRIARAAAGHGGETANLLAALELPLPAVSVTGNGIVIPDVDSGAQQTAGPVAITLIGGGIQVAKLPRAHLGASGVAVDLGNYPGDPIKIADLGAALKKLVGDDKTATIALLAPTATPVETLLPIIVAAAPVAPVYLAVNASNTPEGWDLPASLPIALDVGKGIDITAEMTVQNLASELAKHLGQKKIGLQKKK
jgi:hypothetical protein